MNNDSHVPLGARPTPPASSVASFQKRQLFVFVVVGIIAVIFILINIQFYKIWTGYRAAFGPASQTQVWLDRKPINDSLDTLEILSALRRLESACLKHSLHQVSLNELQTQRQAVGTAMDNFLSVRSVLQEKATVKSYAPAVRDAASFIKAVGAFEAGQINLSQVTASADTALLSWGHFKTESVEQDLLLRDHMERSISAFRPMADSTGTIFLILSFLSVLFFVIGVYSIWQLLIIQHRRFRRFELLVASISHDLRSPMQAIQSASSLLSTAISVSERRKYANIVNMSIRTLARLVDDIALAPQAKSQVLHLSYVNLSDWYEDFITLYQDKASAKGLQLHCHLATDNVLVEIDPERLSQSVGNLLDNAIKYTSKGSIWLRVRLRTQEDKNHKRLLVIKVKDTGPGISPKDQSRIFRPFQRAVPLGQEHEHGMGLGLSIVQSMAKSYKGSIAVQSELGRGSLFKLTLPVRTRSAANTDMPADAECTDPARLEADAPPDRPGSKEILVVDDDLNICTSVVGVLHEAGFAVDTASNGQEALEKMAQNAYRVMISDIQMPGMSGFDLAKTVRELSDSAPFLIAMTAYTQTLADDPRSKVFDGILAKPFNEENLILLIEKAMESDPKNTAYSEWGALKR